MDALLTLLDYLVSELEYYLEIKRAEQLVEELDHLNAIAFLDEIRASAEYRKL
jgi:peptide deformylase